ncbi:MAG: response regulator [Proteobacteria bacterium]|nr:response regulator [Pseudomonadota bacterium]
MPSGPNRLVFNRNSRIGMKTELEIQVLIIDDERHVRENIAAYLEDSEFKVFQAENGRVGLELFSINQPDVVLVDLDMPEVNGFEVLVGVKQQSDEIPVVIVSGAGEIRNAIEASRLGAWDFILKPIHNMSVVEHTIHKVLERRMLLRENRQHRENLEQKVRERSLQLQKRNIELVVLNEQLQEEIQERKRVEAQLRQAKDRSTALRRFSNKLSEFSDESHLMRTALDELCSNIYLSGAVLFHDLKNDRFAQCHLGNPRCEFLEKSPPFDFLKEIFTSRSQEINRFNNIAPDSPICSFHTDEQKVEGGHFIYFRGHSLHQHLFCLYRDKLYASFDSLDMEYIRSMINEINIAYHNIQVVRENAWLERELRAVVAEEKPTPVEEVRSMPGFDMVTRVFPLDGNRHRNYDLLPADEKTTAMLLADVPGRGVSATMYTSLASVLLHEKKTLLLRPEKVLAILNRQLQAEFQPNRVLTMSYFLLNEENGAVSYCSLGYEPLVLVKITKDRSVLLKPPVSPFIQVHVDLFEEQFGQESYLLQSGELLLAYTKGLNKKTNNRNELFRPEILVDLIQKSYELDTARLAELIVHEVNEFFEWENKAGNITLTVLRKR